MFACFLPRATSPATLSTSCVFSSFFFVFFFFFFLLFSFLPRGNDNERTTLGLFSSVRSGARNEVESRSRASTWLKRRASGATPAASAASAATWQAAKREQAAAAAAGVGYHLDYPSRWAIGKPAKNTRSTFSQPASRTAPSGSVPSVLVSSLFLFSFFLIAFFFHFLLFCYLFFSFLFFFFFYSAKVVRHSVLSVGDRCWQIWGMIDLY